MKIIFQSIRIFALMTILTGVLYPLSVTGAAQVFFHRQANGSLLEENNQIVGSSLLAQKFTDAKYFWSRPSAADYATVASGASNQGPTNAVLKEAVAKRDSGFQAAHPGSKTPAEMLFASGSGLDPHISPASASIQLERVALARGMNEVQKTKLKELIATFLEKPQFGILGESRVNVLELNLKLLTIDE